MMEIGKDLQNITDELAKSPQITLLLTELVVNYQNGNLMEVNRLDSIHP